MSIHLHSTDHFQRRHIGPNEAELQQMLHAIGVPSLDALVDKTVPENIRIRRPLQLPPALSEAAYLRELRKYTANIQVFKSYIGLGYFGTRTPAVIQRNIFENPGWYTQYTPYQAEIAQGRLEALLNYQTMVSDLTGLPIANASLLDEGTAASEAMIMFFHERNKKSKDYAHNVFLVDASAYPQTIEVLRSRALPLGVEIVVAKPADFQFNEKVFGFFLQYPGGNGKVEDLSGIIAAGKESGAFSVLGTDLLALCLLKNPGELGADCAVGNSQRFGVPMGFGGPHAAFFATTEDFKRLIPGRIIGVSKDSRGKYALRMALQTREQHIRREKATSNICTAQALLAIMAGMYAVYHGPSGLKAISTRVHTLTRLLENQLKTLGFGQSNQGYFDTLVVTGADAAKVNAEAEARGYNFNYWVEGGAIAISLDETAEPEDLNAICEIFAKASGKTWSAPDWQSLAGVAGMAIPSALVRTSPFLTHEVFNAYHSESEMMRYIKRLENRDLSLTTSMIPLGSCTMKLNAAAELMPVSWPEFGGLHPFVPAQQAKGYLDLIRDLECYLAECTGFAATSLQPNSGAQGEYAGLMVIRAYHLDRGDTQRNVALIPSSAHGTNPASAVMAGMDVVVTKCDEMGNIDIADLREKALLHKEKLSCLMVTYPSTHGVFEEGIIEICNIIHQNGGLVYMDGANMNAQVGLTSPANIGADVCHLNLHKTFAIPHGGGGPGMGPICVNEKLKPYLPGHPLVVTGGEKAIAPVSAAPFGSASILLISFGYIRMLGAEGLVASTKYAILNANYLRAKLSTAYPILYVGKNGTVAHEFIMDFRQYKHTLGVEVEDVAKRLMDYGYHAPTVSFPVAGTLMIEPTESESKAELDKFIEALMGIREEIREIEEGKASQTDNVLKNAPHPVDVIMADEWTRPYSRSKAAFPASYISERKFWPFVGRIDNSYGDRNLVCTCLPMESYMEPVA